MIFKILKYIERLIKDIFLLILFMFVIMALNGCSAVGVDLTQSRTYAITKPPFQIIVSGDLSTDDKIAVRQIISDLSKTDYKDYKFNERIIVTVIGSETNIENVNLHTPEPGGSDEE